METVITLTVLAQDKDAVLGILGAGTENEAEYQPADIQDIPPSPGCPALVIMEFDPVHGIDLEIEGALEEAGIPYSKSWEESMDAPAGALHVRIDEHGQKREVGYDGEEPQIPLSDIIAARDGGGLESYIQELEECYQIMSWQQQDEEIGRFREDTAPTP